MIFIAMDPGMSGAVSIIEENDVFVFDVPTKVIDEKKDYDIKTMSAILRKYEKEQVICLIENVYSMSAQGVVSVFSFGRGKGIWEGVAHTLGFNVFMVSPQAWKKSFPELINKIKPDKTKSKSEQSKEKRLNKAAAKTRARELASKLYPKLADKFAKVKDDGRAEAILMATHIKDQYLKGNIKI